jgi:hypothetical protein
MRVNSCVYCGDFYEINPRLSDGFCDDCRQQLNAGNLDDHDPIDLYHSQIESMKYLDVRRNFTGDWEGDRHDSIS